MNELADVISSAVKSNTKSTGSDYIGTVTRVEDQTAYVQFAGSDIDDTPVAMTVSCKEGDTVRVRVANGNAWITGNDTAPATDDTEAEKRMLPTMENRDDHIKIESGLMEFNGNTIVIDSDNFTLDADGNATFSGALNAAIGTFSGALNAATGTFSGELSAASGHFDGKIVAEREYEDSYGIDHKDTIYIADPSSSSYPIRIERDMSMGPDDAKEFLNLSADTLIMYSYNSLGDYDTYELYARPGILQILYTAYGQSSVSAWLSHDGVHTSSDIRLKENITDIDPDSANALKPVQFHFKGNSKNHYGFIAQNVREVLPDAVSEGKDGFLSLNYQELIAPLYALVQAQQKQIETLEARIKALEDKIS